MVVFKCKVRDEHGIHARPAGALVNCAKRFSSQITVKNGEREANAKRLIALLGLSAKFGDELEFFIEGEDEAEASLKIKELFCGAGGDKE